MVQLIDHLAWDQVSAENLRLYRALGLDGVLIQIPDSFIDGRRGREIEKAVELARSYELDVPVVSCGVLPMDKIIRGQSGRDEQIAGWISIIRAIGKIGVPLTGVSGFSVLPNFRTGWREGRGGALYPAWNEEAFNKSVADEPQLYEFANPPMTEGELWDNLGYFLRAVLPEAEEAGVRLAFHPDDPPVPDVILGISRVLNSVEKYLHMFELHSSPANSMLFCQGAVAEMGEDVCAAVRLLGDEERIGYVHFRAVKGNPSDFAEVFIDEGDTDALEVLQAYFDAGFSGPFMMDHAPRITYLDGHEDVLKFGGTYTGWITRAHANGYLKALIRTVYG